MIQAVIFDCFGVLRPDVLRLAYRQLGGDAEADADFIADTLYASHTGRIASSAPEFAARLGVSEKDWIQAITTDGNDQQLLDFIVQLRASYKIGVLSNVGRDGLLRYFTQAEIDRYFDAVVASGEVGHAKPDPRAYEIAAELLGVPPNQCVFTDDKPEYCHGAEAAGMQAIVYKNFAQFRTELQALLADAQ